MSGSNREFERLSVNVNDKTARELIDLSERAGVNVTEIIRRAVSVYKYLDDEQRDGALVQIIKGDRCSTLEFI